MRRLTVALLTIGLACASSGPATAQSPAASPVPTGQRVEMPWEGFALTFPEGWIVLDPAADDFQEALASAGVTLAEMGTGIVAGAHPPGRDGESPVAWCGVDTFTMPQIRFGVTWEDVSWEDVSLEDTLASLFLMSGDSDMSHVEVTYLDLPAGRAARLDGVAERADGSAYILKDGGTLAWLACAGIDRPADDWLSIAETLEFLPAEE
jgi:hypothetical protein